MKDLPWVANPGEMFNICSCANEWEWVSVNSSQIGWAAWRRKNQWDTWHSVCMCGATPKQWHVPQYDERCHFMQKEYHFSWKWKFVRNASAAGFVMLPLEILISYIAGPNLCWTRPNFQFRCDERWCYGWWTVVWSLGVYGLPPGHHRVGSS